MNLLSSKKTFIPLLLALFLAGCATLPEVVIPGRLTLQQVCERNRVQWSYDGISQVVTLSFSDKQAKALVGSEVVILGDEKIFLSEPVNRDQNVIFVPDDFEGKVILSMVATKIRFIRPQPVHIVIDAGHGGKDPGALGVRGSQEKWVVLDISKRVERLLINRGFKVELTRPRDEFISLEKRTEIASRCQADLFVSIHANSNPSRSVHGLEVYILRELTYQEKDEEQRKRNLWLKLNELSMEQDNTTAKKIVGDMLADYKETESPKLARVITNRLPRVARMRNLGIKKAGFFVLRNSLIPAVLVEVGYLSNSREENLLKDSSYREKVAEGLAESISAFAATL